MSMSHGIGMDYRLYARLSGLVGVYLPGYFLVGWIFVLLVAFKSPRHTHRFERVTPPGL